jgi:hypothetical protein
MEVFYGGAIQGNIDRSKRAHVHGTLIDTIEREGHRVVSGHTRGKSKEEVIALLEREFGPLPEVEAERQAFVRRKMIEGVEGSIRAAVFEMSVPSLGTGIEFAHAYLRPRNGLSAIPVLALYEHGHWPHNLSTMVAGMTPDETPHVQVQIYTNLDQARQYTREFLREFG